MTLYFAYGSNMCRRQMDRRCPDHRVIGKGTLSGYRWIISARGYANIIKSPLDAVYGLVYEISDSDERFLDRYEGVKGGAYVKEYPDVEIHGSPVRCLVYVDPVEGEGVPRKGYAEEINRGIEDAQLPTEYIEKTIRRFITGH